MKTISILIFLTINACMCCNDPTQLSLLPPFHDSRNIQSNLGENLNIVCCHPDGAESLSWLDKFNKEILFKSSDGLMSLKDEKGRNILRIDNIDEKKMGEYRCTNKKRGLSKSIIISASTSTLRPTIIKRELYFPSNKPVEIKCSLTSKQGFKSWIFTRGGKNSFVSKAGGDRAFEISEDRSTFTVKKNSEKEEIKVVWCQFEEVAVNGDLKISMYEFSWTIYDPIDIAVVIDTKGPILESNDVKLTCSYKYSEKMAVSFPKDVTFRPNFFFDNVNSTQGQVHFTINKITKDQEGEYECRISKILSMIPFKVVEEFVRVKVDVVIPPKIKVAKVIEVQLNEVGSIKCQIESKDLRKEDAYFEHYKRDSSSWVKISETEGVYGVVLMTGEMNILSLLIIKVTWEDRGKYRCVAKNPAGEATQIILFKVRKSPELKSSVSLVHLATKPVKIECSAFGYPMFSSEDTLELRVVGKPAPIAIELIYRRNDDIDGLSVLYEVVSQGELTEGNSFKLECFYDNRSGATQQKEIELRIAQKPNIPEIDVLCSGSSGIVFMYKTFSSQNESKRIVKNVISYAPAEDFDSLTKKPSKVVPIKEDEKNEKMIHVLKDLVASRKYTFKWESYNNFGLSNERSLSYSTKDVSAPQRPKILQFSTKGNMINVNVSWQDDCPYAGISSVIRDILVTMKPIEAQAGKDNIWQWTESNFTMDSDRSSLQFLIYLENPQIDYEIQVSLRSAQGTSESLSGVYRANIVLARTLFYCFPRCAGSSLPSSLSLVYWVLAATFVCMLLK